MVHPSVVIQSRNPSTFDIDHLVPLAEAWGSGANAWSAEQRTAFANDLGFRPSLIAVSASSNRSKGDRDPAEWMPPAANEHCRYLRTWVAVKTRWRLAIDVAEKRALTPGSPVLPKHHLSSAGSAVGPCRSHSHTLHRESMATPTPIGPAGVRSTADR